MSVPHFPSTPHRFHRILNARLRLTLLLLGLLSACAAEEEGVALGTLERDRIALTATAGEIITGQPVAEGSEVEAGELLVQFDTSLQASVVARLEAELAQQEATLELLRNGPREEEIAAARARVEAVQASVRENRIQLARIQDLVERQVAAQTDLDTAAALLDGNEARLRDAQAQLRILLEGTRAEELAQAEARKSATLAQLAFERKKLADLSVVATRPGILDSLPFHVGERVAPGAEVAVMLSGGAPYARVYVPEPVRAAVSPGVSLRVHVDGSEESYMGRVRWVSSEPAFTPYYALNSSERSRLVYLAEVQLPTEAAHLPAGLPVQVELPR